MALVNQNFTLEVTPGAVPHVLHVTEYDENMQIVVELTRRGQPFEIPVDTTVKVEGTLDGHPFSADATVDGSNVIFELTKSMTAYAGRAWTKIKLTKDSKPVSSCGFWLDCDRAGVEAGDVIQNSGFQEQINKGVAVYFAGSPPFFGVPPGGKTGQTLTKLSGIDYDTGWRTPTGGGGGGGGTVQSVNRVLPDDAGNVQLAAATQSAAGLMSAADKTALDGMVLQTRILHVGGDTSGTTADMTPAELHAYVSANPTHRVYAQLEFQGEQFLMLYQGATNGILTFSSLVADSERHTFCVVKLQAKTTSDVWDAPVRIELMTQNIAPAALPNPKALTIRIGGTTVTYDGSTEQTVTIDDGTEVSY